jgi:hypothetical protein
VAAGAVGCGFAVVLSLLTSAISSPSWGEAWLFQVAERAVKTFLQTVLGGIGVATSAALLAALYSVVTSVLATRVAPSRRWGRWMSCPRPRGRRRSGGRDWRRRRPNLWHHLPADHESHSMGS